MKKITILFLAGITFLSAASLFAGGRGDRQQGGGPVEFRIVFAGTSDPERAYINGLAADFNRDFPQYRAVVEFDAWNSVMPKILAMANANNPPDIFWGDSSRHFPELHSMGFLQPIDEALADFDTSPFYPQGLELMRRDGQQYTLPTMLVATVSGGFLRNKVIEKFYGPVSNIKTWDDYLEALAAVHNQDYGGTGKSDTYGLLIAGTGGDCMGVLQTFGRQNGVLFKDIVDPSKKKQWMEVINFMNELGKYQVPGYENMDYKDGQRLYINNTIAFFPNMGSWVYGNIYDMTTSPTALSGEEMGIMSGPPGPSARNPTVVVSTYGMLVFKGIPEARKQAAMEFVKYHASKYNAARFVATMHTPARRDVDVNDVMALTNYPDKEGYKAHLEYWIDVVGSANVEYNEAVPGVTEIQNLVRVVCIDMWKGRISPEQAYDTLNVELKKIWN
jgi:ABC-type glycerol-3-phosphate transport system substrate-binding protein